MADVYSRLSADLPALVESGAVSKKSAEALLAHYRPDSEDAERPSRLVPILSIIGAVFVGAGFVLYFAANWDTFQDWAKLAILLVATLATHAAAYVLLYSRGYPKTGHALSLLGSVLYGASIFLVGQIYNLGGSFPGAMLLWLAGSVPMAYATGLASYGYLLPTLFSVWLVSYVSEAGMVAGEISMPWVPSVLAASFAALSVWHGKLPQFRTAFARFGLFFAFSGIFLFTFDGVLNNPTKWSSVHSLFAAIVAVSSVAYAAKLAVSKGADRFSFLPFAHLAALVLLGSLSPWLSGSPYFSSSAPYDAPRPPFDLAVLVFCNLYFVAFAIAAAVAGTYRKDGFMVNLSLAAMAAFVVAKYFDWFFDMMDRALFFIVGGSLFVLGGWILERRRKAIIRRISE